MNTRLDTRLKKLEQAAAPAVGPEAIADLLAATTKAIENPDYEIPRPLFERAERFLEQNPDVAEQIARLTADPPAVA